MMRQWLGSLVFTTALFVTVVIYAPIAIVFRIFGYRATYAVAKGWSRMILTMLKWCCRLDFSVSGLERLPAENAIVLVKHSSAWETIAQLILFPHQTWVLKRELIWAPILGWAIFLLKPIAINRRGGHSAVEQVLKLGQERLREGLWIVIFPEGTRMPAGETRRYGLSGALLAQAAGRPVIPVAHNAGFFWPRRGLLKKAGTISVVVGEPLDPAGLEPRELNRRIQAWIESEISKMSPPN
jgi:1-acyl-sn-glycerol-3-phosphate acyltransferase